ncbi:LacI family DNA-binding transcriptional regulator [Leucothrix pacifica]|uniref:LacI family transcriptional regulator n=1 Tax=Leucothrix pacifica TaxID=1247513 RepID=A0A317CFR7_9GAMM|nr:LacI family DNA-binding transcriptional regulator [Leucothrix pacifica]PWQ97444.1 LacI family transcriptional regulator [Leucothrix pacifica]
MKRVTVHDVAAEAKVSLATVDRVLNARPGVKAATIERVHAAVEKIGFTRDQHAANLAKRREYRICFLLPSGDSAFMQELRAEVESSVSVERQQRTFIKVRDILPFNGVSLVDALDAISAEEFTGVVFIATDAPQVKQAIKRLADRGVIPITLISDIPSSARAHFVGIDNTAAGRTAGSLLGRFVYPAGGKVAVIVGSMLLRDHVDRRLGFEQVIRTEFPGITLVPSMESNDDNTVAEKIVDELLVEHPDLLGIYNIGAAKQGLLASLKRHKRDGQVRVVAHDLTDDSKEALRGGAFDAIIHQDPPHQVRSAIRLVRAYADGRSFLESQERIRIDIFLRDNMPD